MRKARDWKNLKSSEQILSEIKKQKIEIKMLNRKEMDGHAKRNMFPNFLIAFFVILILSSIKTNVRHLASGFKPGFEVTPICFRRSSALFMMSGEYYGRRKSSKKYNNQGQSQQRSKRQERVGSLIRVELANILQKGQVKRTDPIESTLLHKINVVNADVSPDLAQARITVSILGKGAEANIQKRRAYSWLVSSQKMIRHALAQRLNYMKTVPMLTFVLADVGAAVDVMALIDKVSKNKDFKRDLPDFGSLFQEEEMDTNYNVNQDGVPLGVKFGLDFNAEVADDEAWIDEEDDENEDEEYLIEDDDEYLVNENADEEYLIDEEELGFIPDSDNDGSDTSGARGKTGYP